jgi:hypothetical protein
MKDRSNFGTKEVRENNPFMRGFRDEKPIRALSRVDHLIGKVGIPLVQAVESYYQQYLDKPNEVTAKKYRLWRLRLHRHMRNKLEMLREINESRPLGLDDDGPGPLCWDMDFD